MDIEGKRLGNFSLTTRRGFVGLALIPCAASVANHYFGWGLLGSQDSWSIAASFVLMFLVMRYLGPTVRQIREYREQKMTGDR
jgi:hypothetical protein